MQRGGEAWARAGVATLVGLAILLSIWRALFAPEGILIRQDSEAPWIMAPSPVTAMLNQWGREDAPTTRF